MLSVIHTFHWFCNSARNRLRSTPMGQVLQQLRGGSRMKSLRIVSATRLTEAEFWSQSALGRSLKPWLVHSLISAEVRFENRAGLPSVYNAQLLQDEADTPDVFMFVHDDVWLDDTQWPEKIRAAMGLFDVVGVAGNTRISPNQPAWLFRSVENRQFIWDTEYLSGIVAHGQQPKGETSIYGQTPAPCELLDGVFLALRSSVARRSKLLFDERFDFHFYDMDFCRSARRLGLRLGTWPIALTHQSGGSFGSSAWHAGYAHYLKKWRS